MNSQFSFIIMLIAIGGLMFWTSRSQKKQAAKRMESLKKLNKGDEVVTIGGLYGAIDEVDTEKNTIVLDVDGVYLTFELAAIKRVLPREDVSASPVVEDKVADEESVIEE